MKAICYKNTLTRLPNWNPNDKVHLSQSLGLHMRMKSTLFIFMVGIAGLKEFRLA